MTNLELLNKLLESKPSMNNFSRQLKADYIELYNWILKETDFLDKKNGKFTERIYCIIHSLKNIPRCPHTNKEMRFNDFFSGYSLDVRLSEIIPRCTDIITTEEKELLKLWAETSRLNHVKSFYTRNKNLFEKIIANTTFLNNKNPSFSERIYCVLNNITKDLKIRYINFFQGYLQPSNKPTKLKIHEEYQKYAKLLNSLDIKQGKLLYSWVERNKKKNIHLYDSNMILNEDYVLCPVTGIRMSFLRKDYITKILQMTLEEFKITYPEAPLVSKARSKNISNGLKQLDPASGLSKHRLSVGKRQAVLTTPDANGVTGYQKLGAKTKATHLANVDEFGRNGYSQLASKAIINGNLTKIERGQISDVRERPAFYRYKTIIIGLSNQYKNQLKEFYMFGLAGTPDAYQLDHQVSIFYGWKNKISPLVIAHQKNLEPIPWKENVSKHSKCSKSIEALLLEINYTKEQNDEEFNIFFALITEEIEEKIPPTSSNILRRFYEAKNKN